MSKNTQVRLLLLSPSLDESCVHCSVYDDGETDAVAEGIASYRSHLWKQGWNPEKAFKQKLGWSVYRVNESSGELIRCGLVSDFAKDLAGETE
ncbi:hypothetical protein D0962_09505 [Leptolyngbyaceae cyanobacterium CCMR0082]|uniref:Uncharacterized protein n=1 Tax=Adonisia turfae CCMR0082 TaxID=2304604 RepID=A0A6M0S3C0_9CYAN|nr:hypothetical protein [Adonisia turfae]NEZ63014.1 hypothetical protein [Adonisia turfae CCMR0082]